MKFYVVLRRITISNIPDDIIQPHAEPDSASVLYYETVMLNLIQHP